MSDILFINACVRKESRTKILAEYLLEKLDRDIVECDLQQEGLAMLDGNRLSVRDEALRKGDIDHPILKYAKQFAEAECIVIAAPYWDLSFPALLKAYLEQICVSGITFVYGEDGRPHSLCKAKSLYYVTTAGGPIFADQFGFGYVEALSKSFFGIENVQCIKAEGLDIIGADVSDILCDAKKKIDLMF